MKFPFPRRKLKSLWYAFGLDCEASSAAVKTGLRLAQESNATLHLIHVDEIPVGIEDVLRLAAGNRPVPTQQPVASGTGALLLEALRVRGQTDGM